MKKFICCVAALSALIFSSGCGDDEKQVEPVDEYWIEWKNESDYRIDFFYVEGGCLSNLFIKFHRISNIM